MKKILVIGNSFGEDAVRYLYGIARAAKDEVKVAMLFIGGCSLYRHYRNMISEEKVYVYQFNSFIISIFSFNSQFCHFFHVFIYVLGQMVLAIMLA